MLYSKGISRVHLELTNKCNAVCPLCPRRTFPVYKPTEITLINFKLFFSVEFLKTLTDFSFCGNFGEPTLCKDIIPIHEYIHSVNPKIRFSISTNGGTKDKRFWYHLGHFYSQIKETKSFVKFCIDGLENTNHIYRRNVNWDSLMENVKAFNYTGAFSEWSFIPFKHNQHQFEIIKQRYKALGFSSLHIRPCRKLSKKDEHLRHYRSGLDVVHIEKVEDDFLASCQRPVSDAPQSLRCVARQKREIYVDTFGNVFPCCWYGTIAPDKVESRFSLFHNSLDTILSNSFFDHEVTDTWNDSNSKCNSCCWSLCKEYY